MRGLIVYTAGLIVSISLIWPIFDFRKLLPGNLIPTLIIATDNKKTSTSSRMLIKIIFHYTKILYVYTKIEIN